MQKVLTHGHFHWDIHCLSRWNTPPLEVWIFTQGKVWILCPKVLPAWNRCFSSAAKVVQAKEKAGSMHYVPLAQGIARLVGQASLNRPSQKARPLFQHLASPQQAGIPWLNVQVKYENQHLNQAGRLQEKWYERDDLPMKEKPSLQEQWAWTDYHHNQPPRLPQAPFGITSKELQLTLNETLSQRRQGKALQSLRIKVCSKMGSVNRDVKVLAQQQTWDYHHLRP